MKYFSYSIIAIVVVAVVVGFFFAESPAQVRLLRLDEQRVGDLKNIQSEIVNEYYRTKQRLPENLENLIDDIRGNILPVDPVTAKPYEYRVISNLTFELCSIFDLEGISDNSTLKSPMEYRESGYNYGNWQHGVGKTCFERTIDPEIYKPIINN